MTPSARRKKRKDEIKVTIAPFRNLADYKTCEDIQKEVWDSQDIDIVPVTVLLEIQRTGGIVLGAYSGIGDLIGFECGIPGSVRRSCMPCCLPCARRTGISMLDSS
jgi:predicted GNAT superfamily acetyltransferase